MIRRHTLIKQIYKTQKKNFLHSVNLDSSDALKSSSVNVYTSPEWNEIYNFLNTKGYFKLTGKGSSSEVMYELWKDCVMSNESFKPKYFALLPFFFENSYSRYAQKKFILEMNLLPETKHLHFKCALSSGIHEFIEPLTDVIPIPPQDFKMRHVLMRSRPADFIDGDMFYTNRKTLTMYCFDKQGTWNKEGVNHEVLHVKNALEEPNWFDHLKMDTYWQ